ncbi:MAG: serine/threonine-protein phosphatase [Chloroflexi bacterium]|nr:serine/threonine-protein phosphatase [Chloroflexota bacterium]
MSTPPIVAASGCTDVGKFREQNQDTIRLYQPEDLQMMLTHGPLYAVADGMGGYAHGDVASSLALETFFDVFYKGAPNKPFNNLKNAARHANTSVYQEAQRLGVGRMGTTLSAVNISGNQAHIAHIGDSRIYLVRGGQSTVLTRDHTVVGDMVQMRVLAPDKVRTHEQRSILNKCLGVQLFAQPDFYQHRVHSGDRLVLCSDGVWSVIEDHEFGHLAHDHTQPDELNRAIINLSLERDSDDNISVVVIHVEYVDGSAPPPRGLAAFLRSRWQKSRH